MYKYIFILLFLSSKINAQINNQNLIGDWTNIKIRTLDGSKDLSRISYPEYYNWQISSARICRHSTPIYSTTNSYNNCIDYTLDKNMLRTSSVSGYKIEKLDNDSLIVIESIDGKIEKDKIRRIWFVRTSKILNENKDKHKEDSVLVATPLFTPQLKENFMLEVSKKFMAKNIFPDLLFKGNIIIYPKEQKIEFKPDEDDLIKNKNFQQIKFFAENSFQN